MLIETWVFHRCPWFFCMIEDKNSVMKLERLKGTIVWLVTDVKCDVYSQELYGGGYISPRHRTAALSWCLCTLQQVCHETSSNLLILPPNKTPRDSPRSTSHSSPCIRCVSTLTMTMKRDRKSWKRYQIYSLVKGILINTNVWLCWPSW